MSGGGKRISVFDRLGPGADESGSRHRSFTDKHPSGGNYGSTSSAPDKGRSHGYSSSGSAQHKEDGARERKPRHRSSGEASVEVDGGEDKRSSVKGSRDTSEGKPGGGGGGAVGGGGSGSKSSRVSQPSGESDYEDVLDEAKRKKAHRGAIMEDRSKHGPLDEESHGLGRRSGRERKEKVGVVGGSRLDRIGSSSVDTVANKSPDKIHSRREMGVVSSQAQAEYKHRKEDEYKNELLSGHKRKRTAQDDLSYSIESKKSRRRDHSRDSDPHHHSSGGPADGGRYHYGGQATSKDGDYYHGSSGSSNRSRRMESSSGGGDTARRRTRLSQTPEPPESGGSGKQGRSQHRMDKEDVRKSVTEGVGEHRPEEAPPPKARSLDWTAVQAFSTKANSKLPRVFSSVLEQFRPGVVLRELKVSTSLAGSRLNQLVQGAIARDGGMVSGRPGGVVGGSPGEYPSSKTTGSGEEFEESRDNEVKTTSTLEKMDLDEARPGQEVEAEADREATEGEDDKAQLTWDSLAAECLSSGRRALTAADDYAIRRRLRKDHRGYLATARPTPDRWTTDHQYASSVQLYNFVPTKPSGKPATKLLSSRVGSVVISR